MITLISILKNSTCNLIILFLSVNFICSQNTVGVISNTTDSFDGYTLFTAQTETYLINNCGQVINQWSSQYPPGNAVYLLENGNLLRAAKIDNPTIDFGGTGGRIELFDWDGSLIWEYEYNSDEVRQHHDIFPMPNGNILILAVKVMSNADAIQAGRDPNTLSETVLYNEQIIEIQPTGTNTGNIIWEWNIQDHFIQDLFADKDNYGVVEENPQLLDINYLGMSQGNANWMHINSMQYYDALDQIVLSSRLLNEFYIIDHSTSTSEAASHSGGIYGKGGDLLYRWGNPQSYKQGGSQDQKLFGQHFPHFIPNGLNDAGKIILYNNGFDRSPSFSEVFIIDPMTDAPGFYSYTQDAAYGPLNIDYSYIDPDDSTNFYSAILSSAQRLPNGNILICEGTKGRLFEIDNNDEVKWEYINPVTRTGTISQGTNPLGKGNALFRALKYDKDYPAFNQKDLSPGESIESPTNIDACLSLSMPNNKYLNLNIYPNPIEDYIQFKSSEPVTKFRIYSILGEKIKTAKVNNKKIDISTLQSGIYIIELIFANRIVKRKFVKK
ncbi:aryl-sulfate sulfotransferase [Hyunsoonleella aestuarii]|uniref:Secretion system C-terminal sorting domain-containing protein n=1 Tax=Hyunsoonleella aestuarii TaxID=912802 RepID=A0ABP8E7E3_9FLAO|nr:aryl-sulfate sulfotransferase [Hyunsoonleella aestuarii]